MINTFRSNIYKNLNWFVHVTFTSFNFNLLCGYLIKVTEEKGSIERTITLTMVLMILLFFQLTPFCFGLAFLYINKHIEISIIYPSKIGGRVNSVFSYKLQLKPELTFLPNYCGEHGKFLYRVMVLFDFRVEYDIIIDSSTERSIIRVINAWITALNQSIIRAVVTRMILLRTWLMVGNFFI